MKDVILLGMLIIFIIFGYWVMKKVDIFLEESFLQRRDWIQEGKAIVRIAIDNPLVVSRILDELKILKDENSNLKYYFYTGNHDDIKRLLDEEKVDIAFLINEPDMELDGYSITEGEISEECISVGNIAVRSANIRIAKMYILCDEDKISDIVKQLKLQCTRRLVP